MTPGGSVIVWNSLVDHSLEVCRIERDGPLWRFEGIAVLVEDVIPVSLTYSLEIDRGAGRTDFVGRLAMGRGPEQRLVVAGTSGGEWRVSESPGDPTIVPALHGACCIDLGWTPLTNTFALWHLDLPIGGSGEITAAWVPFPALSPEPARQWYTRLSDRRYRYEQPGIDFRADLDVDEDGFVVRYGTIWEQVPVDLGGSPVGRQTGQSTPSGRTTK